MVYPLGLVQHVPAGMQMRLCEVCEILERGAVRLEEGNLANYITLKELCDILELPFVGKVRMHIGTLHFGMVFIQIRNLSSHPSKMCSVLCYLP